MSSYFNFQLPIIVDQNVSYDAELGGDLPTASHPVDMGVRLVANFVSGTYREDNSDPNDISSNFTFVQEVINNGIFIFLNKDTIISEIGEEGVTNYNVDASALDGVLANSYAGAQNSSLVPDGSIVVINTTALTSGSTLSDINNSIYQTEGTRTLFGGDDGYDSGIASVVAESVAGALFKKFGYSASISNDAAISNDAEIRNASAGVITGMNMVLNETNANYTSSTIFRGYLDSGRYAYGAENAGEETPYNFEQVIFQWIVQVRGNVVDTSDGGGNVSVEQIFGTYISNVESNEGDTKVVANDGTYAINVLLQVVQDANVVYGT